MAKRGKMKAKLVEENEEETHKSVIVLSSDEEANEDLSLKIVERARSREAKRRREEDLDEFKASDGVRSASVIDLSSSSSDEIDTIAGAIQVAEVKKKKRKKKKKTTVKKIEEEEEKGVDVANSEEPIETITSVETEAAGAVETDLVYTVMAEKRAEPVETNVVEKSDNMVLRKLLRGPRYFDPPDSTFSMTCYNCGEEGHMAVKCTSKRRKKPCFVCGSFEHGVRNCTQGKECFICNKKGHRAKDCPEKHQQSSLNSDICLRCGESGHNMFSCTSDYAPEDLKEIQCYVCKKLGHLCCVDTIDAGTGQVSCYNCGQTGHAGSGCAKQRGEISGAGTPTLCYKCGEEGHFARGCTKYSQPGRRVAGSSTPIQKSKKKVRSAGVQSVPPDVGKIHKKKKVKDAEFEGRDFVSPSRSKRKVKNIEFDGRDFASPNRSKGRGGWITDDPGDLPNRKFKANVWRSPTTPTNKYHHRTPNFTPGGHFSNSGSPWSNPNYVHGTPAPNYTPGGYFSNSGSHWSNPNYQHRYTASRFGNPSGGWDRTYNW